MIEEKKTAQPRKRRSLLVMAVVFVIIGGGIVLYPFFPLISYQVAKPNLVIPYQSKIGALVNTNSWPTGMTLPEVGNKPVPAGNRLVIPSIGVDVLILEGPDERTLNRGGIWHIPQTSTPDQGSNTVVSGHRFQYLPPSSISLYLLDKVKDGDLAIVYWQGKEFDYKVTGREIVKPDRVDILNPTANSELTIFTCTPLFTTKERLILHAKLIS